MESFGSWVLGSHHQSRARRSVPDGQTMWLMLNWRWAGVLELPPGQSNLDLRRTLTRVTGKVRLIGARKCNGSLKARQLLIPPVGVFSFSPFFLPALVPHLSCSICSSRVLSDAIRLGLSIRTMTKTSLRARTSTSSPQSISAPACRSSACRHSLASKHQRKIRRSPQISKSPSGVSDFDSGEQVHAAGAKPLRIPAPSRLSEGQEACSRDTVGIEYNDGR